MEVTVVIAALSSEKASPVPFNHPVQVVPQSIQQGFEEAGRLLFHKMHIASSFEPIRHLPKTPLTRFAPSRWGVRRDDYECRADGDTRSVALFRKVAAEMAHLIITTPIPTWKRLLPGSLERAMKSTSRLHLADYWLLTLHHLLWCKKLPYPVERSWLEGAGFEDEKYYMVSELPVDLAEASHDAVVLFQDAAAQAMLRPMIPLLRYREEYPPQNPHDESEDNPQSPAGGEHDPLLEREPSGGTLTETAEVRADGDEPDDDEDQEQAIHAALELDDQSFTVRFGSTSYRFTGRNKQLFALLERINRRPGFRVQFDDLRSKGDVWDGSPVEDSTIRGAVTRLRKLLKSHGMEELANRIATGSYRGNRYTVLHHAHVSDD